MKKISVIFPLMLALVACMQDETGGNQQTPEQNTAAAGGTSPRQTGASQEVSDEEMTDEERQARDELKVETAKAYKALKKTRNDYNTKLKSAKTAYGALATGTTAQQNRVQIPTGITGFTEEADQDKIYASLGYDNKTIENLNNSIRGLSSVGSVNAPAAKTVTGIFNLLVALEDSTRNILDTHLSDANLEKIEKDKDKIEKAAAELKSFIASRDAFIESIKKSIEAALDTTISSDKAKAELGKISAKTPATSSTKPGDAGYCHSKVEAVRNNEAVLNALMK